MKNWLCAVGVVMVLAACSEPGDNVPPKKNPVPTGLATERVESRVVDEETWLDGSLEAISRSTVSSEVSARVMELPVEVDDYVEQGAVIVRFRDADQQAQRASARARLEEARAQLTEARQSYERGQELVERELIAPSEFDRLTAAFESARARVNAAEANLQAADEQLERTVVRAPYSGIVEERHIELGETASPGQPLMTGLSLEHLRAVVSVPQSLVGPLRTHRRARVVLPGGESLTATEVRISPSAEARSHSFRTLVTLPEGDHGVFPGTLVKVAFKRGETEQLRVPEAAVVRRSEVTAVYVVHENHRVELRQVRLGSPTPEGRVPVLSGLVAGERVALDPIAAGIALKEQRGS